MKTMIGAAAGCLFIAGMTPACAAAPDASKFQEPIPQQNDAALAFGGSQASSTAGTQAAGVQVQGLGNGGTSYASLYEFTWKITEGVDTGTFAVLAAIAAVTHTPPTTVDSTHAVWGPAGDALDPINWRVTVTETATDQFDYEVDGRPHGSARDADFKAIVKGHGFGKASGSYRSGTFLLDGDVMAALDPSRSSGGKVNVTYDARSWPRTVTADITTSDGTGQWYDATVSHAQDGSGLLQLTALADASNPKDGTSENVADTSRWNASGAGRADVKLSGGDFGAATVLASQCWSSTFAQTYYTDSVNYQPTAGDPATCAFAQAQFSQ